MNAFRRLSVRLRLTVLGAVAIFFLTIICTQVINVPRTLETRKAKQTLLARIRTANNAYVIANSSAMGSFNLVFSERQSLRRIEEFVQSSRTIVGHGDSNPNKLPAVSSIEHWVIHWNHDSTCLESAELLPTGLLRFGAKLEFTVLPTRSGHGDLSLLIMEAIKLKESKAGD